MSVVFADANVLAQATPRTLLYLARIEATFPFQVVFSPLAAREAERVQRAGAQKVSVLAERFGWRIVPDPSSFESLALTDTHVKDVAILAAAIECGADFVITGNVRHFGDSDLARHRMSAVHPGLFLAQRLDATAYRTIIERMALNRSRPPNTPISIHTEEVSDGLPDLLCRFRSVYGPAESLRATLPGPRATTTRRS